MDGKKYGIKNFFLTKINRKLTLLFIIVALIAPTLGIYYFYVISVHSIPDFLTDEQAPMLRTVAIMIIILIAIDAGIVGFFVSRSISKPIREMYNAARKVEAGNYDVRLDIKTHDEIEELAEVFNRTTASLGKLEAERKEIDNTKTEFLSITSHELRSPMTPMKAHLQMLEEEYFGKLQKKQKDSLRIIIRNADRLDNIIADFLEISRIEAARLKFNFEKTDLRQTIMDTVKFMEGFAKEKNIKFNLLIDKLPIIEVDSDRVSQVFRNIINNAIKFSKENSKIQIAAELKKDCILCSIKDNGCGINPENQIRIFEPFFQVESTSRRRHGGTGLGLTICRGIVESQNGKIWVESKLGIGSKFYFTIPLTPIRKIKPIKVLFSQKSVIERKIREEFKTILGPLGDAEFDELKSRNALSKDDLFEYIESLTEQYIITPERGVDFKYKIDEIFGDEKDVINKKEYAPNSSLGDEVLK